MTHKLLLADDSVTIQRVVELTFSGEDVQVVTVGDGEQAIARIPVELPDIVLADIGMPKRSGYDVSAFVKGRHDLSHIPVLLLAGAFEPVDEARAQQVQCDGVLVKPFEPQQVISRVKDLIESARAAAPRPAAALPESHVERSAPIASPELRTWNPEPRVQSPEPTAHTPEPRTSIPEPPLDDYFERLDAAFAKLGGEPERRTPAPSTHHDQDERHDLPTLDGLLTSAHADAPVHGRSQSSPRPVPVELTDYEPSREEVSAAHAGSTDTAEPSGRYNGVADMFAALFALEQGDTDPPPVQRPVLRPEAPAVTEALVDEVTRRVIERLAPDTASELVTQIVSEVAERLIREEIARIKSAVGSRL